eukprot:5432655-Pyramimonas_sp.AAC.1
MSHCIAPGPMGYRGKQTCLSSDPASAPSFTRVCLSFTSSPWRPTGVAHVNDLFAKSTMSLAHKDWRIRTGA